MHAGRTCNYHYNGRKPKFIRKHNFFLGFKSIILIAFPVTEIPKFYQSSPMSKQNHKINSIPFTRSYPQTLILYFNYANLCSSRLTKPPFNSIKHAISINQNEDGEEVSTLANQLHDTTLQIDDADNEIMNHFEYETDDSEKDWENTLIGKIIIEGRMSRKSVEKHLNLTWDFIDSEEIKVIQLDQNIVIFKFTY